MSFNLSPFELATASVSLFGALQKPEEFAPLLALLYEKQPKTILEIGVGNCGSTWAFSKLPSVEHIICLDLPSGPWGGSEKSLTEQRLEYIQAHSKAKIYYIAGNSQNAECLKEVEKTLQITNDKGGVQKAIDFLLIDGDHSYAGCKTDYLTYSPLVTSGGLIAFHDIAPHAPDTGCEVEKFWEEVKASGIPEDKYSEFIQQTEPSWGGLGVVQW